MKKNIFYLMMLAVVGFALTSCSDDESEGKSYITYYPQLEIEGPAKVVVAKGSAYEELGYSATLNGEDVSDQVTVSSDVNTGKSGVYTVTYSIVNADGIAANARRTVIVLDTNSPVEGLYKVDPASYRLYDGAQVAFARTNLEVLIFDNGDGTYNVDDLLGGWYCQRAGYGSKYAMEGVVSIDATGAMTMLYSYVPGWSDAAESFTGQFDAATNHISWVCEYTDYPFFFYVELDKE